MMCWLLPNISPERKTLSPTIRFEEFDNALVIPGPYLPGMEHMGYDQALF